MDYATITIAIQSVNANPPVITVNNLNDIGYVYENSPVFTLVSADNSMTGTLQLGFSDPDLVSF